VNTSPVRRAEPASDFIKEGNCFTAIADTSGFAKIAATLSEPRAVGRLSEVCERWIYRCGLCFALDFEKQKRSGFRYRFSNYQMEYSRNLISGVGGRMEQVFQALIDRSRGRLDLKTIKTILGDKGRPKYRPRNMKAAEWEVAVERPTYDLTVFRLHCGKLALKIYSKANAYFASRLSPMISGSSTAVDCWTNLPKSSAD